MQKKSRWIPLTTSIKLIFTRKHLFFWSMLLFCITIGLTWIGYTLSVDYIDQFARAVMPGEPQTATWQGAKYIAWLGSVWDWLKHAAWTIGGGIYLLFTRITAFFLAFIVAYTITTPGYIFLSAAAEKLHADKALGDDAPFTPRGILRDIVEGLKIGSLGIFITILALFANFIPIIGQVTAFLLYCYYSALLFLDFAASRKRWKLKRKMEWVGRHKRAAFRIGALPALVTILPVINIFALALLSPLFTVHATLNFAEIEMTEKVENKKQLESAKK